MQNNMLKNEISENEILAKFKTRYDIEDDDLFSNNMLSSLINNKIIDLHDIDIMDSIEVMNKLCNESEENK